MDDHPSGAGDGPVDRIPPTSRLNRLIPSDQGYGVELRNRSLAMDALGIAVTATFVDKYGRSVTSDSNTLTAIPAGKVFYLAGYAESNVSLAVAGLRLAVQTTSTRPKGLVLPQVSDIHVSPGSLGENVTGRLTNPYRTPLPSYATIYAVFFGPKGEIVDGALELADAAVEPSATVSFSFSEYMSSDVVRAQVSVDPCHGFASSLGEQCPVSAPQAV